MPLPKQDAPALQAESAASPAPDEASRIAAHSMTSAAQCREELERLRLRDQRDLAQPLFKVCAERFPGYDWPPALRNWLNPPAPATRP